MTSERHLIHAQVQVHYANVARIAEAGRSACCGPADTNWGVAHYDDLADLPDAAALASLGCGNPTAVAGLHMVRPCSTSARAAGSTCSCPRSASARPATCTGST